MNTNNNAVYEWARKLKMSVLTVTHLKLVLFVYTFLDDSLTFPTK